MNKFSYKTLLVLLCSLSIFTSCIDENFTEEPTGLSDQPLLSNVIADQNDLSTFNQLIDVAGLRTELVGTRTQDQRAIFAPSNEAIANYLASNGYATVNDIPNLVNVISYHIANPNILQANLSQTNFNFIQTIADQNIFVNRANNQIRFNNQQVNIIRSIEDANGTVHVVDQVLIPRASNISNYIAAQPDLSIFRQVVTMANLQGQFNSEFRTFFAPTNAAFGLLLNDLGYTSLDELVEARGINTLRSIVQHHILPDVFYGANLRNNQQLTAQFTGEVRQRVVIENGQVAITYGAGNASRANVVEVNNNIFRTGFVHKIDRVMMPVFPPRAQ